MNFRNLICILFLCCAATIKAQDKSNPAKQEENITSHHHHHQNEIGIANAPVYFIKEKTFSYGLHLHYLRSIGESKFGIGAGYERIFDEHGHNTFGVVASYSPVHRLSFILSPGLTLEDEHPDEPQFALHAETVYGFEIGDIHLGPVIEFAYDPEDFHISIGLHVGYGF